MLSLSYGVTFGVVLSSFLASVLAIPVAHKTTRQNGAIELSERCQAPKFPSQDPLDDCPRGTVFVSQRHPSAKYRNISSALVALPEDGSTRTILIDSGEYNEKVVVTRTSPTILAGVSRDIRDPLSNRVRIWQSSYINQSDPLTTLRNCDAVVLSVGTGSSAGSSDFKAYNIDFTQRQYWHGQLVTQDQLGPSAALCMQAGNASFYACSFESYQDTLFVGSRGQAFFFESIVRGMTDQLYGSGKAWFERVKLLSRACRGGITAWRGNADNLDDPSVGVYISNSVIDRSPDAITGTNLTGTCHLGRPWNAHAHAVYLNTWMSDIVSPAGFKIWSRDQSNFEQGVTRFAEYKSSGPGGNLGSRNSTLEHVLTDHEAKKTTYNGVFGGSTPWIDAKRIHHW